MAELLPACNTVILDEAHQLPETATVFFGETVSTGQVLELCRDALAEALATRGTSASCRIWYGRADKAARDLRLAVPRKEARMPAAARMTTASSPMPSRACAPRSERSRAALAALAERGEGLANCARRAAELAERARALAAATARRARALGRGVHASRWRSTSTPLSVAEPFRRQLDGAPRAWIFTSATLAVRRRFRALPARARAGGCRQRALGEPVRLCRQRAALPAARRCRSRTAPSTPTPSSTPRCRCSRASGGRAFLLFTTLRAMRHAHERLARAPARERTGPSPAAAGRGLAQRAARALSPARQRRARRRARRSGRAWTCAARRCRVVVIDKLPFAPPDDPVLAARLEHLRRNGRNPFLDYQVPQAAIALKQGAGRLIRDEHDRGVLMLCDPRVLAKPYGRPAPRQPAADAAYPRDLATSSRSSPARHGRAARRLESSARRGASDVARDARQWRRAMKVLITGGGGFIGYRLARKLLERGTLAGPDGKPAPITQIKLFDGAFPPSPDPRLRLRARGLSAPAADRRGARPGHRSRCSISRRW